MLTHLSKAQVNRVLTKI